LGGLTTTSGPPFRPGAVGFCDAAANAGSGWLVVVIFLEDAGRSTQQQHLRLDPRKHIHLIS